MFVVLTCFHKSLKNRFWQEGLLLSGIKAFYLFSSTWFVKHIFSYIFNALTSLLQENANLFAGSKTNKWHFENRRKFSEKCSIKSLKKLRFQYVCHEILVPQRILSETNYAMSWLLILLLPILFAIHVRVYFFCLIHHNVPHVYLYESHTFFLIFS